ncbi:SIS domain-containing protein [Luteibacter anthropi]|uniref:SIS domain-containing protein n=1 Tax=Luteibacter anthropi TaxID=564369 RepID=A0A7X5UBJ8_9GAMM|nr:SIS domain-containing protein [Luteibacter anthropi]NII07405.1 SIS domain-containing protein [Luteibacter anthropi]URX61148.1 SIS domain-containing protein [Luteibacter anthropi]
MTVQPQHVVPELAALRAAPEARQRELGYADTLREILQQPATWRVTAGSQAVAHRELIERVLAFRPEHVVITGSGSSVYVGEAVAPVLQAELGVPVRAIPAGDLLTHRVGVLAEGRGLLVSIARSGNSPESVGAVDAVLTHAPAWHHLAITCNADGALATRYTDDRRVDAIVLDERTNDRSLVMTSSFTNMLLAASEVAPGAAAPADGVAALAERVVDIYADALASMASSGRDTAVYLGSAGAFGAAREAALKMLEMSGGDTVTLAETFLGFRHGPMAWLNRKGLLVAFLSGDVATRAYESDLLRELNAKNLGATRVVVGQDIDPELVGASGLAIDLPGLYDLPPAQQLLVHTFVGQWLAFFRCLQLGHKPDTPSEGVLTRVVGEFALHIPEADA